MKTTKQLDALITAQMEQIASLRQSSTAKKFDERKKAENQIREMLTELSRLRQVKRYLEAGVSKEQLEMQATTLQNRIDSILSKFETWKSNQPAKVVQKTKNLQSLFEKEMGIGTMQNQLINLKFILS